MSEETTNPAFAAWTRLLGVAFPLTLGVLLLSGGFFEGYEGTAVGHRPIAGADGVDDKVERVVLAGGETSYQEVVLPTESFQGYDLPLTPRGVPPATLPSEELAVVKHRFSFEVTVGDRVWPTLGVDDGWMALLFLLVWVVGHNLATTGVPWRVVGQRRRGKPLLQRVRGQGNVAQPPRAQSQKGPPPSGRRKKRRR